MKFTILLAACLLLAGCPDKNVTNIIGESDVIVEPFEWDVICDDVAQACILYKIDDNTEPRVIFKYIDPLSRVNFPSLCRGWQ